MESHPKLQPGLACGECNVCCRELVIDDPALTKLPGVACPKLKNGVAGCTIYSRRPHACREFECGWLLYGLGPEWRPDRSRIVIIAQRAETDNGVITGIKFHFFADLDAVYWPPFIDLVWDMASKGAPLFVSAQAPVGFATRAAFLNTQPQFIDAVQRRDFAMTASFISWSIQACISGAQTPVTFRHPTEAI